jgi:hypothetical protein
MAAPVLTILDTTLFIQKLKMKVKRDVYLNYLEISQLRCIDYSFISDLVLVQDIFIAAVLTCVMFLYTVV